MISIDWRSRGKAALIHLAGSSAIATLAAVLVFLVWYPWPYSSLSGGNRLYLLITGVDVTLGPVLTFAIFNRKKPLRELVIDLAIIVGVQLGALGYGLQTMYGARPVALALEIDRFRVVRAVDVDVTELPLAPQSLRSLPQGGPVMLWTARPATAAEQFETAQRAISGSDVGTRPKYWRAWDDVGRAEVMLAAKPVSELASRYPQNVAEIDQAVARTGLPREEIGYLPMIAKFADWSVLVSKKKGDVVGFLPLNAY